MPVRREEKSYTPKTSLQILCKLSGAHRHRDYRFSTTADQSDNLQKTPSECFGDLTDYSSANLVQIIQVNLTSDVPKPLVPGTSLEFTYSVKWEASSIPFPKRFERYLDYNFFEHQVRRNMIIPKRD